MLKSGAIYFAVGLVEIGASVHGTARLWFGIAVVVVGVLMNLVED